MNLRGAGKFALIPFVGTTPRADAAPEDETAQRAEVGHRPCCARANHVATPPICALGSFEWVKSRGMASWRDKGTFGASVIGSLLVRTNLWRVILILESGSAALFCVGA